LSKARRTSADSASSDRRAVNCTARASRFGSCCTFLLNPGQIQPTEIGAHGHQKVNHNSRSQARVFPTPAYLNVVGRPRARELVPHEYRLSFFPMPVDLPSVSKVYQDQLTTLSHGLALWNPNPPKEIYDKVSIGDVGYLHEGSFIRMFNVILPWSHESNRTLGEPEPYESLDCGPFANTLKRQFDRVKHCSRYVSETNAGNRQAMMTPE
jgi:hypothetical protein